MDVQLNNHRKQGEPGGQTQHIPSGTFCMDSRSHLPLRSLDAGMWRGIVYIARIPVHYRLHTCTERSRTAEGFLAVLAHWNLAGKSLPLAAQPGAASPQPQHPGMVPN